MTDQTYNIRDINHAQLVNVGGTVNQIYQLLPREQNPIFARDEYPHTDLIRAVHNVIPPTSADADPLNRVYEIVVAPYVTRQLDRTDKPYPDDKTRHYITWMAWQMNQREMTGFYSEALQITWLHRQRSSRTFRALSVLSFGLIAVLSVGLIFGPISGLSIGLGVGLSAGGFNVLKHIALRAVLHRTGQFPFRIVRFLHYTADLNLTRQVGGGMMFKHRPRRGMNPPATGEPVPAGQRTTPIFCASSGQIR